MNVTNLKDFLVYCKTKYKPRSHSYQKAVEDCEEVLAGNFSEIRTRDLAYEQEYRKKLQARRKKK